MAQTNLFSIFCFTHFFLIHIICANQKIISPKITGNLPDPSVISKILNEFLRPAMSSIPLNSPVFKALKETSVEKVIREKVEDLQLLLQDNDVTADNDNLLLDNKDDTTIIEFLPKTEDRKKDVEDDSFKSNLKKYKKIREKINKALKKESVSEKTSNLVIKTLDDLIKSLVSSQCKWKRNLRAKKSEKPSDIATKWNKSLQKIKDVLASFLKNKSVKSRRSDEVLNFLDSFQLLFRSVTEDIDVISKNYKILCDFVPKGDKSVIKTAETNYSALRNSWDKTDLEEDRCQYVIICSNELKEFLINFYYSLNDTAVSVLRNYAEMYNRDVNVDNENEKDGILTLLNKIINNFEYSVTELFIKETQKLNLDKEKNKHANIKALSSYVTNTVENVKAIGKHLLNTELPGLKEKILTIIMDDLNVNIDVDFSNLEREYIRKICNIFRLCNGIYRGRRQGGDIYNKNKLYVQVHLTLDNDVTNIQSYRKFFNITQNNYTVIPYRNTLNSITNLTVTRTTLMNA